MQEEVFARLKECAAAYRELADAYDQALLSAHNAGHGTPVAMEHLRKANAIAPDVLNALKHFQAAVAALAWNLSTESSFPRGNELQPGPGPHRARSWRTGALSRKG